MRQSHYLPFGNYRRCWSCRKVSHWFMFDRLCRGIWTCRPGYGCKPMV